MSKHERSFEKAAQEEASTLKQPQLKPFETPKGFVAPTLGEQFRYVRTRDHAQQHCARCFICLQLLMLHTPRRLRHAEQVAALKPNTQTIAQGSICRKIKA